MFRTPNLDEINDRLGDYNHHEINHLFHLENILNLKEDDEDQIEDKIENRCFTDAIADIEDYECYSILEPFVFDNKNFTIVKARIILDIDSDEDEDYKPSDKIREIVSIAIFQHYENKRETVRIF